MRADVSARTLAALHPLLAEGVVTTGNMSAHWHAAAAYLVVAEDRPDELGLSLPAYLVNWAAAGCDSDTATLGAAPASPRCSAAPVSPSALSIWWRSTRALLWKCSRWPRSGISTP
ncbi:hypothetical protein [Nocardia sp. NPDC051463]|uniref:hypothetical protein n=1 Tax=Nocardia sp. NPDC051463 TaxID=3154845 RepID=UPI00344FEC63